MKRPLDHYKDIHSHNLQIATRGDTLVSITPVTPIEDGGHYSVGIHPWTTTSGAPALSTLKKLVEKSRRTEVKAIGECGFDTLRGGDPEVQQKLFDFHARLAARTGKPLIIHAVRSNNQLFAAIKKHSPAPGMWIIHGFRGKPELATQLVKAGYSLSFGKHFNADAMKVIPPARLYRETDDQEG